MAANCCLSLFCLYILSCLQSILMLSIPKPVSVMAHLHFDCHDYNIKAYCYIRFTKLLSNDDPILYCQFVILVKFLKTNWVISITCLL